MNINTYTVLIIDDEPDIRELLEITLNRMQISTNACGSINEAKTHLCAQDFDLCLTDMRLPDGNGLDLVDYIQQHQPRLPVAVITAHGSADTAVRALKSGAFDFISKPINLKNLRDIVLSALKLPSHNEALINKDKDKQLLGSSPALETLRQKISKLARSQAHVHIHGESGTGKELVAGLIHHMSARAEQTFVPVNCSAIPAELIESEFFGHIKGSFTGASQDKQGLFAAANGGTLFLDEVADLSIAMQVKLLRAIQEKSIRPVGSTQESSVDVRILSATHKNLDNLVKAGEFRQDLFYRINVIQLDVPPLRHRPQDTRVLIDHFLQRLGQQYGQTLSLSAKAISALLAYPFPGNVRELENILERAVAMTDNGIINETDLALGLTEQNPDLAAIRPEVTIAKTADSSNLPLNDALLATEKASIEKALEQTHWNKTEAAKLLGMSFRQLRYRIKKFGIE